MATDSIRTEMVVLRQTAYSETSLIVAGLSPEHGQIHLLVKGARRSGKKAFPAVDLFRCLDVVYRPSRSGDLHTAREATLQREHDGIARSRRCYATAGWIAQMLLQNTVEHDAVKPLYAAVCLAFARLAADRDAPTEAIAMSLGFVLLDAHGLLPDMSRDPDRDEQLLEMLCYADDPDCPAPEYPPETWSRLLAWLGAHFDRHDLKPPPPFPKAARRPAG